MAGGRQRTLIDPLASSYFVFGHAQVAHVQHAQVAHVHFSHVQHLQVAGFSASFFSDAALPQQAPPARAVRDRPSKAMANTVMNFFMMIS